LLFFGGGLLHGDETVTILTDLPGVMMTEIVVFIEAG
jgi:hypothetical protein